MLSDLHCSQFRQADPAVLQADVVVDAHRGVGLLTALSAFETGMAAALLLEKVAVGGIQMAQALLKSDAVWSKFIPPLAEAGVFFAGFR